MEIKMNEMVGRTVQYTDKYGQTVTAKIVKSDGWSFELDNGGTLRALSKFLVGDSAR